MRVNKHACMAIAVGIYGGLFIPIFATYQDSIQIAAILLMGCFGWLYGSRIALLSVISFSLINAIIIFFRFEHVFHEVLKDDYPLGILLSLMVALISGFIHDSNKKLERIKSSLSDRVKEATNELEQFTQQLIERDEEERIRIGQDLHDGVGQWLTGMLLQSESLNLKLKEVAHSETALGEKMTERIRASMHVIRKLSRSQLPIQPTQMSIEAALEEMAAYFRDISSVKITINRTGNSMDLPSETIQHLYRIAQETIHCAIYECRGMELETTFAAWKNTWRMTFTVKKMRSPDHVPTCLSSSVLKYRIKAIGGKLTCHPLPRDGFHLECTSDSVEKTE